MLNPKDVDEIMEKICVVDVWLPLPLSQTYSYRIPEKFLQNSLEDKNKKIMSGTLVRVPFRNKIYIGVIAKNNVSFQNLKIEKLKDIEQIYFDNCFSQKYIHFLKFVSRYTMTPFGLILKMALRGAQSLEKEEKTEYCYILNDPEYQSKTKAGKFILKAFKEQKIWTKKALCQNLEVSVSALKTLEKHGVILKKPIETCNFFQKILSNKEKLNEEQEKVVNSLSEMLDQEGHQTVLLDGVTGSGKTEVYFEIIVKILNQKQQVLILLPEIALTQQFLERFHKKFGFYPVQWHSGLSREKREKIWRKVQEGKVRIVVGARSAIFLPFPNLKLMVIDEEHDQTFKQEENVLYHARDIGIARAYCENFFVILASATPSLESYANALRGKYRFLQLKNRYENASMPMVRLVDRPQNCPFLSIDLQRAIEKNLENKEKSLLFLNRRGYSSFTICRNCGYKFRCNQCSTYLNYHQKEMLYKCHQCDYQESSNSPCPQCLQDGEIIHHFAGVERIYEEVSNLYPKARLALFSSDILGSVKKIKDILSKIENDEIDIIIGTQMIAKGHNFKNLTLVGILDADFSLKNGDFRSAERLFQLLSQVTGRAGRGGEKSFSYIQTNDPTQPLLKTICENDKNSFYRLELERRKRGGYPPYGHLASLIITGKSEKLCKKYARTLRQKASYHEDIKIFGPTEAEIFMIRNLYRYRLLLKSRHNVLQNYISKLCKEVGDPPRGIRLQIDIDPQSFL